MRTFYLKQLRIYGGGHKDSIIDFVPGVNFILGPSNTGKSLVVDCIDYIFGFTPNKQKPSKIEDNNNGYDTIELSIITSSDYKITFTRKIAESKVTVNSQDPEIESGSYNANTNTLSQVFLKLIGIKDVHKVLSSQKGKTQNLTWRSLLHLFLMKQVDVDRETSALRAPGYYSQTSSPATLLFLLTGQDAEDIERYESAEVSKAKKNALLAYIREQIDKYRIDASKLSSEIELFKTQNNIESKIDLQKEIDKVNREIDESIKNEKEYVRTIYALNSKLSEACAVEESFLILKDQYSSDLRRLDFIVSGTGVLSNIPDSSHCPICNSEIVEEIDENYIQASIIELGKLKTNISELEKAINDVTSKKEYLSSEINRVNSNIEEIREKLNIRLKPLLNSLEDRLSKTVKYSKMISEQETLISTIDYFNSELTSKEKENNADSRTHNILENYQNDMIQKYEKELRQALSKSKIGGSETARFNMMAFDLEIDGKAKASSMGGGYNSILNTLTAFTMSEFLIKHGEYATGFFIVDSVLTQLSESEFIRDKDSIKRNFIDYLIQGNHNQQIIIVEQKKRMPYIPDEKPDKVKITEFTGSKKDGRYGFLYDVFNAQD